MIQEVDMRRTFLLAALLILPLLAGCAKDSSMMGSPPASAVTLTPADGSTGVRLDAPVTIRFGASVDRAVVQRDLHLLSEYDMTSVSCSDTAMHGTMTDMMADSTMLRHMEQMHATSGTFTWDQSGTVCTFQPASWMRPQTRYMIHMGSDMTQMMSRMMDGMGGYGSGGMAGDMMFHFTTMDTTGGGGHDGHH